MMIKYLEKELKKTYKASYGSMNNEYLEIVCWVASMSLETIATSDALYHNVGKFFFSKLEHTIFVTLVGQDILRGKHIKEGGVKPLDWLHFTISLLCHDIGYVKGVCKLDDKEKNIFATGKGSDVVQLEEGKTDASLTPFHVDRGNLFIKDRFENHKVIDYKEIQKNIELTRFPVPQDGDHNDTKGFPGIVRAADLLGQLSDPRYLNKTAALFYEFTETGSVEKMGFKNPGDLKKGYPLFFWGGVFPYVKDAIEYLKSTSSGRQHLSNLFSNVFMTENITKL